MIRRVGIYAMILLRGPWKEGYAYSSHSVSSEFLGNDDHGIPRFKTVRTAMGECLYRIKYWQDSTQINAIMSMLISDVDFCSLIARVDEVLIVPPSNIGRVIQPVVCVATKIAEHFGKPLNVQALQTTNREQIKNLDEPDREAIIRRSAIINTSVLDACKSYIILDDVYDTGSTLKVYAALLQEQGFADISIFTLTKVRSR